MSNYKLSNGKILYAEIREPTSSRSAGTIVFLHGLGSSTCYYYPVQLLTETELADYRVITFDFDGHGRSPVSTKEKQLTIESLAEDVNALLDAIGVFGPVSIVAHSMSGLVASHFASLYPSRVDKMLLLGPVKALSLPGVQAMQDRAYLSRSSGLTSIANLVQTSAISPQTRRNSPLACGLLRSLVLGTSREGYARACEALAGARNPDWNKIRAEVLIVGGKTDYLSTPEVIAQFCELIQDCRSVELEEVGHWLAIESPVKVAGLIVEFFK